MSARTRTFIRCDHPGCDRTATGKNWSAGATEIRWRAKAGGWTVRNKPGYTRLDYCPDHSKDQP